MGRPRSDPGERRSRTGTPGARRRRWIHVARPAIPPPPRAGRSPKSRSEPRTRRSRACRSLAVLLLGFLPPGKREEERPPSGLLDRNAPDDLLHGDRPLGAAVADEGDRPARDGREPV